MIKWLMFGGWGMTDKLQVEVITFFDNNSSHSVGCIMLCCLLPYLRLKFTNDKRDTRGRFFWFNFIASNFEANFGLWWFWWECDKVVKKTVISCIIILLIQISINRETITSVPGFWLRRLPYPYIRVYRLRMIQTPYIRIELKSKNNKSFVSLIVFFSFQFQTLLISVTKINLPPLPTQQIFQVEIDLVLRIFGLAKTQTKWLSKNWTNFVRLKFT